MFRTCALIAVLAGMSGAFAQSEKAAKEAAPKPVLAAARTIEFIVDEATWMSVDIHPDGKTLLVDVLGDLYTVPTSGGKLQPLTSGMEWDYQARYSPDGRQIAFISDRDGSDNVWIMNADGSSPRQVTKEKRFAFGSPTWSPDGSYIVARRWGPYPLDSYLRRVDLWMFHKEGGAGIQIVKPEPSTTRSASPVFSPDGKYLYFSSMSGRFNYDADLGRWQIHRLNRETAKTDVITSNYGGGLRPLLTPDGKHLIYATRHDAVTELRIRNLETRDERRLAPRITRDDQEGFSTADLLPGYAVSPDGRTIYLSMDGKLSAIEILTGVARAVPFTVDIKRDLAKLVKVEQRLSDAPFPVKQMRWLQATPDASGLVFSALGKLWIGTPGGTPHRLTSSPDREYAPAISPDGLSVAYVTWNDREGGRLWKAPLNGGAPVEISQGPAFYSSPQWSPDGKRIAFFFGSVSGWLRGDSSEIFELRTVSSNGGRSEFVTQVRSPNGRASWSRDGARLLFSELQPAAPGSGEMPATLLLSVRLDGLDRKTLVRISEPVNPLPSPDENWLLLERSGNLLLTVLPRAGGDTVALNLESPAVPVKTVTLAGALYAKWRQDSQGFSWAFTNKLFRANRDAAFASAKPEDVRPEITEVRLEAPRAIPQGRVALRNARIVTMNGTEVLERGDVMIENNRIAAVGASGRVAIPADARQFDLAGKTIIPGIVDVHAHLRAPGDVFPDQNWAYAANLAYGVTTTRDPSSDSSRVFPYAEMVEAGEIAGPRIYSTGNPLVTTVARLESLEDARAIVKRFQEQGATFLKQYMQPRRIQRQWLRLAAEENNINITAEGAGFLKEDLAMVIDGYTGFEHNFPVKVHRDVVELVARAKTVTTPTLVVSFGGYSGQFFMRKGEDYHADAKLANFTPHDELDRRTRRRPLVLDDDFSFPDHAAGVAQIVRAGGGAGLGSHGEQQGIGAHWELWMLQMGGLSPHETLRVATLGGAQALGYDRDIGSIEAGKLADLLVLEKNPLENIRNSRSIQYVVKNGDIFEGNTLDRVWPSPKKMPAFYWKRAE